MTNTIEYICNRITSSDEFEELYIKLIQYAFNKAVSGYNQQFLQSEYYNAMRYVDFLSNSEYEKNRSLSLKLISMLYEHTEFKDSYELIIKSVLSKFGLFSAEEIFTTKKTDLPLSAILDKQYRIEQQKISGTDSCFTNRQFEIYKRIHSSQYFSFSGPTSLGKSFLIKNSAIELLKKLNVIVFILPTKALLDEYLIDLRAIINRKDLVDINVTKSVSGFVPDKKNILIFTQERYNNLIYNINDNVCIDAIFIDEAHKLSDRSSNRALTLYKVISKSIDKYKDIKLIFSSPVISNPNIFFSYFGIEGNSLHVKESPVCQNLYFANIHTDEYYYFDQLNKLQLRLNLPLKLDNEFDLITLIGESQTSNLIYISSKETCVETAYAFLEYVKSQINLTTTPIEHSDELNSEAALISEYIHKDFLLCSMLPYGIAYHNGSLPPFIRKRLEDLYSQKKIKYMFCTSTLLEGVNLPTKNVFIYPFNIKTDDKRTTLNFWNLAGRAGRYKNELAGNIICVSTKQNNWTEAKNTLTKSATEDVTIDNNISLLLKSKTKIINYLHQKTKSPDAKIVELCSLLISEVMELNKSGYLGPTLQKIDKKHKHEIIEACQEHIRTLSLSKMEPKIFSENHRFNSTIQSRAFNLAKEKSSILKSLGKEDVFSYIELLNSIYHFRKPSDEREKSKALLQLQIITYDWLRGNPLNRIISNSIQKSNSIYFRSHGKIPLDRSNPEHINIKITETIETIENEVSFKLESAAAHFHQICSAIHGEQNAGYNLSSFLEYGTINKKEIALQEYGFSRAAAKEILMKYSNAISFDANDLIKRVNIQQLSKISGNSFITREVAWLSN
ncbi:DEAD/DEAH box helicase [Aeromonas veronii]|uniref:DEAD/DEAH box helicase n=1 Tax=Aeromonas veronii TaxID=654 RepID=UPI000D808534